MLLLISGAASDAGAVPATVSAAREPALDQYLPSLPSADGGRATGAVPRIAPALRARLRRSAVGTTVLAVVESRALGTSPLAPAAAHSEDAVRDTPPPRGSVASALRGAAASGLVAGLLVGVGLLTAAAVASALVRRRAMRRRNVY